MKRRTFLLGVGLIACSGPATTTKMRTRKPKPPRQPSTDAGLHDLTHLRSQRGASRVAVQGDVVISSVGNDLDRYNATTMQRTDTWTIPHRHFCFAQDGSVLTFGWEPHATSAVIHRIVNRAIETLSGPLLPGANTVVLLPGRSPDELYASIRDEIFSLRVGARVELEKILKHPVPNSTERDQLISRGDGRLVAIDASGVYAIDPSNTSVAPIPKRYPIHLAAGTGNRIWYSFATLPEDWNAHTLICAPVDQPISAVTTIDVAPSRFVHIASHGDMLAGLLTTVRSLDDITWSVAVFDEKGRERWRADVASDFASQGALNSAFIAIGPTRVVLATFDGKLLAWDAANGKPIG